MLTVLAAPSAWARDPIVPLQDIHRGMTCTARTVVQGTTISDFDVEVLDVLADTDGSGPRILVRVSGPAVDRTGIAEGFSGSPVYCTGPDGTIGNAGAISATIGQYGADVGLVTPIELMLGLPVDPPVKTRVAPKLLHAARPLASPLVIAGLSPSLGHLLEHVARAQGRSIVAAPAGPLGTFPPQELVPGASLAATLSSGAVTAGAVGTVTYRDGTTVYGFGHGFDAAGRRALQLADAYVFTVVGNPLDTQDAVSYKLAAPGHPLGVLTNDAPAGVVGTLGGRPRTVPLTVTVRDLDRGTKLQQRTSIVDESALENPSGTDLLSAIAPLAVAQGITTAFNGSPSRESGVLCLRVRLRESKKPLHFCNRYVVNGSTGLDQPAPLAFLAGIEVQRALSIIGKARFATLHVERVSAGIDVERGAAMAHILSVSAPRKVRPGQRVRVAMRVRVDHGPIRTLHPVVRIPHDAFGGPQLLSFRGSSIDIPNADTQNIVMVLLQLLGGLPSSGTGAEQLQQVISRFERIERYDGVKARLGFDSWRVYRDPALRIDGSASTPVRVVGTKRRAPRGGGGGLGQIFAELFS
ncbi:MAG TPA: hypothetical protein VKB03_05280 [Conexibacter sp.]|nr:hypothetical protein [Conexibacter sp.]